MSAYTPRSNARDTCALVARLRDTSTMTNFPEWIRKEMVDAADMIDDLNEELKAIYETKGIKI